MEAGARPLGLRQCGRRKGATVGDASDEERDTLLDRMREDDRDWRRRQHAQQRAQQRGGRTVNRDSAAWGPELHMPRLPKLGHLSLSKLVNLLPLAPVLGIFGFMALAVVSSLIDGWFVGLAALIFRLISGVSFLLTAVCLVALGVEMLWVLRRHKKGAVTRGDAGDAPVESLGPVEPAAEPARDRASHVSGSSGGKRQGTSPVARAVEVVIFAALTVGIGWNGLTQTADAMLDVVGGPVVMTAENSGTETEYGDVDDGGDTTYLFVTFHDESGAGTGYDSAKMDVRSASAALLLQAGPRAGDEFRVLMYPHTHIPVQVVSTDAE